MNSTEVILDFLSFIADLRKKFGEVHLVAERCPALHDVTTEVIPFKGEPSDYAERGVTICLSLIAELRKPIDSDKKAIGVDLLLRHTEQGWIAEAEIGWSGRDIGWDNFEETRDRNLLNPRQPAFAASGARPPSSRRVEVVVTLGGAGGAPPVSRRQCGSQPFGDCS